MRALPASVLQGALLTGLYFAGAVIAILYLRTPADVTLFWPAAGIGYVAVLRYGLKYAATIAIAQLLLHLLVIPVPAQFLPFSIASNAVGTLVAGAYVQNRHDQIRFRMSDGLLLLRGGLVLALVSAGIGTLGMLYARMVHADEMLRVLIQWWLGDLLGITSVAPALLLLFYRKHRRTADAMPAEGGMRERATWLAVLLCVLAGGLAVMRNGSMYPLALATLPLGLLLWSAARFPPAFTATATMAVTVFLALVLGLGLSGFDRPESMRDTGLMMGTLTVNSVIPMLLVASYQERFNAMTALHVRATRDPLTGLLNRDAFEDQARNQLANAQSPLTLLYVDLDHFKLVNDSASHVAGDEVIRNISALVHAEFGTDALIARSGGDEFSVLVPQSTSAALMRGRNLLAEIETMRVAWQGQNLGTTASIGLATSQPPHMAFDELLSQADAACFEAKEHGGNRLFATEPNADDLRTRARLMHSAIAAREALDQRRFDLWCQPIVDLRQPQARQAHFEVLLRWRDDDGNLRPPAELITAAERYRLGPRLDRYVLDTVLGWLEAHPHAAGEVGQCNINLSAATLADEEFGDYFAGRLHRSALSPEQLCLEITETSVVRDMNRTRRFIGRMRDLGCRFALDDFGTGFCSFGYLRDLDVDYLKIDGSFVRNLDQSDLSEAVVRSITEIAHLLGMRAVAEHAETHVQLEHLRALGVDYAQGYVFQRPIPIEEFFGIARAA
ncbi:MAG: EAL domain-containing protein [Thermomonas sp.]|uniref:putative bifunctional diguanylate cyclase/phosphodiesterase n=1 Tax=Thermomonas sp. TaxID=1971895 RepID=UPI0039E5BC91